MIMKAKTINEYSFERNQEPKDAMGTGLWKKYEPGVYIPLQEFKDNGWKLEKEREIFNAGGTIIGFWKEYDHDLRNDIIHGLGFEERLAPSYATVKVPTKIMYA